MTRLEIALWCENVANDPAMAKLLLKEVAKAARDYPQQTRTEVIALDEIFSTAVAAFQKVFE